MIATFNSFWVPLILRVIGKAIEFIDLSRETTRQKLLRLTGGDIPQCPHCGKGAMCFHTVLYAGSGYASQPMAGCFY